MLQTSASTYVEASGLCDGTQAAIITSRACEIPLTILRAAPFSLPFDALILAKVSASNTNGEGPASLPSAVAAKIQTEPQAMAAPTRGDLTSETQL